MEDKYSAREVVAIVEDLKGEFRVVAEAVTGLSERVGGLETRVSSLEVRVGTLEDVIRIGVPSINRRLASLEARVG